MNAPTGASSDAADGGVAGRCAERRESVVRPYMLIGGRTPAAGDETFHLVAVVTVRTESTGQGDGPEQARILRLCRADICTVVDLAADMDLPLGVIRVLLGDLRAAGLIDVSPAAPLAQPPETDVLQQVLNGLRAL
ncbi:DUF742 domain-containing protein [Streptomyces sp. NPDC058989]|uniref:DUF742 domain-containing protein n=1 Tax=Streptomyces sp. NPDC058989 TaxID=3346686 RepID=UPI0036A441DE